MQNKKFTIEDINECLRILGFEWVERYVLNSKKKEYEYAELSHFSNKPVKIYIRKKDYYLVTITVSNENFIVGHAGERLDASMIWQDLLNDKLKVVGNAN